jgi:hypothetical protein
MGEVNAGETETAEKMKKVKKGGERNEGQKMNYGGKCMEG